MRKSLTAILGFTLGGLIAAGGLIGATSGPTQLERQMAATVMVSNAEGHGSGVLISPHLVLTANHVVDQQGEYTIERPNGEKYTADVLWQSPSRDTALLRIKDDVYLPYAELACRAPELDEPVTLIGNQTIARFRVSHGAVSSIHAPEFGPGVPDEQLYKGTLLNIAAGPGDSGGPVFDADGRVLGLLQGGAEKGGYPTPWMIPSTRICDLLAR
jgi:S1-C subfamily serine protease